MIQTWFCNCPQYFCLFGIVIECIPGFHDQRKRFSQINVFHEYVSTSDDSFVSFQPILCHPHTQIRINLFHGVRMSIPNWKPSPDRTSIGFSQIAFPMTVPPKDDHTDFVQEERPDLPHWTMISAICVVVEESKSPDIPILEFSIILEHLPFSLGF